ncbi:hypothetical protein ACWELO_02810 [Streptomyces sp. NPDC004596]
MTRSQRLTMADAALQRAAALARDAETRARHEDTRHEAAPLAAVGALWADIARTHTALADTTED